MPTAANFVIRLALQTEKGELVAQISRVGAALRYLAIDGVELVESGDVDSLSPFCEGVIMSPWPNRIDGGKWTYQGRTLELPINLHDQQNSNHGLLMDHHYQVLAQTESSVTLGALIHARLGYPFNVQTSVTYELVEGGLRISHTAENLSTADAPYALGGHPYFKIAGVDTEDLFLRSDAATVLVVDDRQIPTGTMPTAHSRFDMRSGVRVGDNFYDHDFTDLPRDSDGLAHTYLTAPDGRGFDIWQDENFKHVVIFTPDFYFANLGDAKRFACAIEPQTSGPNSFNSGQDLIWLKQGQKFSATWGVNFN
ncbi:MAG: aldose 1-epimerase family protein [Rhodoluna sp.]|nr:aldose 1-epimerase family protein [Rhodoluna sp.]